MIQKFDSFKLKKAGDVKIITLKIDGKAVVIDQEYPRSTTWESFHADQLGGALETEPRYVLLDHDYTTTDGRPADKIILISWIPDTSPAVWKSTSATRRRRGRPGSVERRGTGITTPSSRRRVDGVEDDAMIQHERAVKF